MKYSKAMGRRFVAFFVTVMMAVTMFPVVVMGSDVVWELNITPQLAESLNTQTGVVSGLQRALNNPGEPTFVYSGGALVVTNRTATWNSFDIILRGLGVSLTTNSEYRLIVQGAGATNQLQTQIVLEGAPWDVQTTTGANNEVSFDFTYGGVVEHNSVTPRIRVRTSGMDDFTVTSVTIVRLGEFIPPPPPAPPQAVCENSIFDMQEWLSAHNAQFPRTDLVLPAGANAAANPSHLGGVRNSGRWPFWNTGNQDIVIENPVGGLGYQFVVPAAGTGGLTIGSPTNPFANYGQHGLTFRVSGPDSLPIEVGSVIRFTGYVRGTITNAFALGPGVGIRPPGVDNPWGNYESVRWPAGRTNEPFEIEWRFREQDIGTGTANWAIVREPSQPTGDPHPPIMIIQNIEIFPVCECNNEAPPVAGQRRLGLQAGSPTIYDLVTNTPIQEMDVPPLLQDGRTLVPVRYMAYVLGAEIDWTPATATSPMIIYITLEGQTLSFAVGEITPELYALGMEVPAQIIDGRTMVPLRFIGEFFGAQVGWNDEARSIELVMG